ncbi:MAG: Fic family protein [Gammaproteobacteria bacterium]|nr:Fic family protein [Gammaproteobacteria bacterium]
MRQNRNEQITEIVSLLEKKSEGLSRGQIMENLSFSINDKTLQRILSLLSNQERILKTGDRKATKYYPVRFSRQENKGQKSQEEGNVFSPEGRKSLDFLDLPLHAREKVSYKREFIEGYAPNETAYVSKEQRDALLQAGRRFDQTLAAGTYARKICQRLLIDLSYNSSRLEGNTYSRLDTRKLVQEGISAEGKTDEETVMIMNHKEAILFLVENAQEIEPNRFTIFNLHNLLSQDLIANPEACGNIRKMEVDIGKSTYKPLGNPHALRELFELILMKAGKIENPFEQSFFLLVHLSYLQAFEDVNKRTSRLSCNIPFIKKNLCPLSFTDVPSSDYTAALLAVYEKNEIRPMLDLFCWAYMRSCRQYDLAKQSLGEIDTFRIRYRKQRKEVMGMVIREGLHGSDIEIHIEKYCADREINEVDKFMAITLADLDSLHAGIIVGLGISEAQLNTWRDARPE